MFIEIIELNIFGLEKNTKKNIVQRSKKEIIIDRSRDSIDDDMKNRISEGVEIQMISLCFFFFFN